MPGHEPLLKLYRTMVLIRTVESRLIKLFADSEVPGFIHLSIGQEAVAAGVMSALDARDSIATTHRGHGHVIARGIDLDGFFGEVMGKAGGICRGRGGSMHVADMELGILGANGIVAAGIPIALGSALGHTVRRTGGVSAVFFGDGAMAEGVLHETLNLAALWRMPLLLVCENNGWSEFSATKAQFAGRLDKLAAAFGIEHREIDGNDAEAVASHAQALVSDLRAGRGPAVLECRTHRVRGHYEGDPQKYRSQEELSAGQRNDPLAKALSRLRERGVAQAELEALEADVGSAVSRAIDRARADVPPRFADALADVYTTGTRVGPPAEARE